MQLGIFAKTFVRPTLEATLDAVGVYGLDCIQFNMSCVGLPTLPEQIDRELCGRIHEGAQGRNISIAAVSGTFNMIHPDKAARAEGLKRLEELARVCKLLGTRIITLCTGTRDPEDMWRRHPDNDSQTAWCELLESMIAAMTSTEFTQVTLAFEPEVANVVDSARVARRLLDFFHSPRLKVVIDPANLFHKGELNRQHEILDEAFDLLGKDIVLAHAKDLTHDGEAGDVAAGKGRLDYDYYLSKLCSCSYDGPLILHGLRETEVRESVAFLRGKLKSAP
jgi:sugar phosphate isomerase/epimerase